MTDDRAADAVIVNGVAKHYGGVQAVDNASFAVAAGSLTALIGPNGAGKSTLLNIVSGFERLDAGQVSLCGEWVSGLPPYKIARLGMVRTFQLTKSLAAMTVLDNMMLATGDHPGETLIGAVIAGRRWRKRERAAREMAHALLVQFRLDTHANEYAGTLSGGQRKLLEFARALMLEPRVLLLDEPLAGVNAILRSTMLQHMRMLRDERGMTVLFVEHDLEAVMSHADRIIVLAQGRVVAEGSPEEIRGNEQVVDAYLGSTLSTEN
jgi:neutral amino acid transport system ATP-binding protein